MRFISIIILAIVACIPAMHADGILFEDITLPEAQSKAAGNGKLVFVDCYTPTCGPCKFMADKIFPLDSCGRYMNPRFVSVKKDLAADENRYIAEKYNVRIYPTFLILRSDGSLYYKIEGGAVKSAAKFIAKVDNAVVLGNMEARYNKGQRDSGFMRYYLSAMSKNSPARLRQVLDEYLPSLTAEELSQPSMWKLVPMIASTDCPAFRHVYNMRNELSSLLGDSVAGSGLLDVYQQEFINKRTMASVDFGARINELVILEQEGMINAGLLKEKMLFRNVINKKDSQGLKSIASAIDAVANADASEASKVDALADLKGIRVMLGDNGGDLVRKAYDKALSGMTDDGRLRLKDVM